MEAEMRWGNAVGLQDDTFIIRPSETPESLTQKVDFWIKQRPYWPVDLTAEVLLRELRLVYLPYWAFQAEGNSEWRFRPEGMHAEFGAVHTSSYTFQPNYDAKVLPVALHLDDHLVTRAQPLEATYREFLNVLQPRHYEIEAARQDLEQLLHTNLDTLARGEVEERFGRDQAGEFRLSNTQIIIRGGLCLYPVYWGQYSHEGKPYDVLLSGVVNGAIHISLPDEVVNFHERVDKARGYLRRPRRRKSSLGCCLAMTATLIGLPTILTSIVILLGLQNPLTQQVSSFWQTLNGNPPRTIQAPILPTPLTGFTPPRATIPPAAQNNSSLIPTLDTRPTGGRYDGQNPCTVMPRTALNVNLRRFPSTTAPIYEVLTRDDPAHLVDGRYIDTQGFDWWRTVDAAWVRADAVQTEGGCDALPLVDF
jgi:hypothetical protein